MRERRPVPAAPARCKLVLVGDVQCGKTAMLQVLAKDCYPETYVPTVFENYTACLANEEQRVELSLWDTSGTGGGAAFTSEKSVHSIFRTVSGICLSKAPSQPPRSPPRSLSKRLLHLPSRSELISSTFKKEKAKSCSIM
ncbi:rho-related GTP-binding protein Rho6 [Malurus melanocephalus]|uniref:rho-related GTP-binding protein Rho6 n=1 Tax=Malurus melanocephalus TaxID=175006 RepID=UPI0025478B74|nr:rho-related GTP-binding protein Rho6 [Malurus melanocephalus]